MDDRTPEIPATPGESADAACPERHPTLILFDADEIDEVHRLARDETIVGRHAGCDIVIAESQISRRHVLIHRTTPGGELFELLDLDSTNGTFLNGERVVRSTLRPGDAIGIGNRHLTFTMLDTAEIACRLRIAGILHIDDRTGLLTERSVCRALEKELARALRYRHQVSVLTMDIDPPERDNDALGQVVESLGPAEVGRLIRELTRSSDVSGRHGEEFIIVLPETDAAGALAVAERIRDAVARRTFRHDETRYQLRVSVGIATAPGHGTGGETLVRAADTALSRARSQGRDRCAVYDPFSTESR